MLLNSKTESLEFRCFINFSRIRKVISVPRTVVHDPNRKMQWTKIQRVSMFEKTTYKSWKPFQAPYGYRAQSEKIQQHEKILPDMFA